MPGVPSGRGCEACRKQKKKCNQAKPACSRCARLNIACVGAGQRRFKFKDQSAIIQSNKPAGKSGQRREVTFISNDDSTSGPWFVPYSETMQIASAFISTLEVSDVRYSVSYYGGFLKYVPQRLGTNQALDAAVMVIATASSCLRTGESKTQVLVQYGNALKALRLSMSDPIKAQAPETLCAIYLVMICQGWVGLRDDSVVCHGEVMAHILNAAAYRQGRDSFRDELAFALTIPVIVTSMVNPNVKLSPYLIAQAETYGPPPPLVDPKDDDHTSLSLKTLSLSNLAKLPGFIREPERHLFDMQLMYGQKRIDIARARRQLVDVADLPPAQEVGKFSPPVSPRALIYLYYTAYVLVLALALIINGLLRALDPLDVTLIEDSLIWTDEVMIISEHMAQYRPLGAGFIPICLTAAWAATSDPDKQRKIRDMVLDYQTDYAGARFMDGAIWLKDRFDALRLETMTAELERQRRSKFYGQGLSEDSDMDSVDLSRSCCIQ